MAHQDLMQGPLTPPPESSIDEPGPNRPEPRNTAAPDSEPPRDRLARAQGLLIDLDGTLVSGNHVMPGARALLDFARNRYAIVSNNSRDTSVTLAHKLGRLGMKVEPERIVLAGEVAVRLVAERYPGARVRVAASPVLARLAATLGCRIVTERPDVVLLGRDLRFGYAWLTSIANQLRDGAALVVANPDRHHPGEKGELVPETGALMHALVACAGVEPVCVVGKPEPLVFGEALRRVGTPADATLVIGDNPATDAQGAERLSMPYLLVGSHPQAHVSSLLALFPRKEAPLPAGIALNNA